MELPFHPGVSAPDATEGDPATRVLIADDAETTRALLTDLFAFENLRVVGHAGDGAEAIERACALEPDVVLMDLHMPRVDGVAASAAILELCPRTQIVVLTSHPEDQVRRTLLEAGVFAYLNKGDPWPEICDTIRRAGEFKRNLDRDRPTLREVTP